jgi:AcrR family transcriptional regulator
VLDRCFAHINASYMVRNRKIGTLDPWRHRGSGVPATRCATSCWTQHTQLFLNQRYDATSTRQISEHAGVAESMLFRHFGSKKVVFEEAILRPVVEFVQAFIDDWVARPAADVVPEQLSYRFVAGLSKLCNDNPDLIEILSKKDVDGQSRPLAGQASALMQEFVDTLTMRVETYHADLGLDFVMALRLSVQLAIALIVGAAHLGEDFLGEMDDRLIADGSFRSTGRRVSRGRPGPQSECPIPGSVGANTGSKPPSAPTTVTPTDVHQAAVQAGRPTLQSCPPRRGIT